MPRNLFFILLLLSTVAIAQQTVTVKPGDTLWSLSQHHNITVEALLNANGLTGTDLLPGAILTLPSNVSLPESYTVQTGDTLYDIAVAFNISVDSLIAINNIDGTTIKPGQVLSLKTPTNNPPAPLVLTVNPGDSLWAIATDNDTTIEAIMQANSLSSDVINPGAQLVIPGRYASTSNADQGGPIAQTIQVAVGDTLWDIAKLYNTSVTALISANSMNGTDIVVGQNLRIIPGNELLKASLESPPQPSPSTSASMIWPLNGPITSYFGYRRLRIGGTNSHYGLDIDGETGDPIVSATTGTVTFSGWRGGLGNLVIIQNGNTEYLYGHCSELFIAEGQNVAVGQLIATVGSTGRSTGSHLHFEVRVDGTPVDPLPILEQQASR
jgi:murein DD-endopeptidase MepM/ murein hydrolase activator NlpD